MALLKHFINTSSRALQLQPTEQQFEKQWMEFNNFYMLIIEGSSRKLKDAIKKYRDLLNAPQIAATLREMSK